MHWQTTPIHFIDFEGSPQSGIVEYGVVTVLNSSILETHTRLCAPVGKIDAISFAQHGIREEDAATHTPFSAEWECFNRLRQSGVLAAHHASVEDGFLRAVWPYPSAAPDFLNEGQLTAHWSPWLDTRQLAQRTWEKLDNYKLTFLLHTLHLTDTLASLADRYCPPNRRRPHCALYDALASYVLFQRILCETTWENADLQRLLRESKASLAQRNENVQTKLF